MPPDRSRTAEALLSQSDWVRALVRGLGVDESGTDDVLQATWMAALTRPPRATDEGASFRAWIARVARNFALRRIDRDARRAGRERDTAKEERLPSASDVVEREEARAEVVRALLDVHEPYRTALLLRFYEGLEPRDIARLQSVPASTVRNRLKRGLALLRERLETSQGPSWRQRCLLVLPAMPAFRPEPAGVPQAARPAAAAASGGALMIKSLGIAAAVAVAAGGAYFAWPRADSNHARVVSADTARGGVSAGVAGSPSSTGGGGGRAPKPRLSRAETQLVAAPSGSSRAPADANATDPSVESADDGVRCAIRGRVTQLDGSPLGLFPDGALRMRGMLARKEREVALFEQAAGSEDEVFTIAGQAESTAGTHLLDEAAKIVTDGEIFEKRHVEEALAAKAANGLQDLTYSFVADFARRPHVLVASASGDARELDVDGEGRFEFGDLRPDRWRLVATAPGFLARRMEFEIGKQEAEKRLDVTLEPMRTLRVKLVTPEGQNLVDAVTEALGDRFATVPFATRTPPGARIETLATDPDGRFGSARWRSRRELDETAVGDASGILELTDALPLHVGVAVSGIVVEQRLVGAGTEEAVFVVSLDRIRALVSGFTVEVVSAQDRRPLAGASVRVEEFAGAVSGEDGTAELHGLPPGMYQVSFEAKGTERRAEWVRVVAGERTDLGVRDLGPGTTIRGRVVDESGAPVQTRVQLRSLEPRSPTRELAVCDSVATDPEGRFVFDAAGLRKYVLGIDSEAWAAPFETVEIRGGNGPEIVLRAAQIGEMRLTFPIEPPAGSLYVVETTDGIPVAVRPADGWQPLCLRLGNGNYLARIVSNGGPLWTRHLILQPGQMIAFDEKTERR